MNFYLMLFDDFRGTWSKETVDFMITLISKSKRSMTNRTYMVVMETCE